MKSEISFSELVRNELCSLFVEDSEQAMNEIYGFIKARGSLNISQSSVEVLVRLPNIQTTRRFLKLLKTLSVKDYQMVVTSTKGLWPMKGVQVSFGTDFLEKIGAGEVLWENIARFKDPAIFGAFLRGFYLGCGSILNPSRTYHWELTYHDGEFLKELSKILKESLAMEPKIWKLRHAYRLSLRRAQDVVEVLHLMGAIEAANHIEELIQQRSIASDVNRSMNFISANADRIGRSTAEQLKALRIIEEVIGIDSLDEELKQLAKLRLENEDLSLRELGELMTPKMSKSMVYSRMKKILSIARSLFEGSRK
ncbi:DNA-binding protein WhiA [Pseudothermotoga sp.]|uniref:DNA-binding protein WhiA n=1 Tax=Pseudothermotoga sp. TaxID=2033661 RepID=UPI0031F6F4E8